MKKTKKVIALILAIVLTFSLSSAMTEALAASTEPTTAADDIIDDAADAGEIVITPQSSGLSKLAFGKMLTSFVSKLANALLDMIIKVIPGPKLQKFEDYTYEPIFTGTEVFADEATADSWKVGYASDSLLPDDLTEGEYYIAGYFGGLNGKKCTGTYDDQRLAAVALDAGEGIVVFISIDGFGMTGVNVNRIRSAIAEYAQASSIELAGVNVSCTHAHSCVDIHGLGANVSKLLKFALTNFKGESYDPLNEKFFDNLITTAKNCTAQAISDLKDGSLYFGTADAADIIRDKQTPIAFDGNINNIKFVPDDAHENEIWLVNLGVHPTCISSKETNQSADYPGEIVRFAREQYGADVAFFQGASAGIAREGKNLEVNLAEDATSYERCKAYGQGVATRIAAIDNYIELDPILNISYKDIYIPVTNNILVFAVKIQFINNKAVVKDGVVHAVSEVGYCEIGKELAIALFPCEMSAEVVFGGTKSAAEAWNGVDWTLPILNTIVGERHLIAFGLTNDQAGYVVPDNDYANPLASIFPDLLGEKNKHYEELLSLSGTAASTIIGATIELIESAG